MARPNKFRNKPITIEGTRYASRAEARRGQELAILSKAGVIKHLIHQPQWLLEVNGYKIGRYTGDFSYFEDGALVVEDVKSPITAKQADYKLRKKLMLALYGIEIEEV